MSLAKLLATSIARLYAYAMAPDDHTDEERREIIDQADEAIDAANAVVWLEEVMEQRGAKVSCYPDGTTGKQWFLVVTPEIVMHCDEGMIESIREAIHEINHPEDACSQPEVDEQSVNSTNQGHEPESGSSNGKR